MERKCSLRIDVRKINRAANSECLTKKKMRLILLLFVGAGWLFFLCEYISGNHYQSGDYTKLGGAMGIFLLMAAALSGIFVVSGVFKDLTSKQHADVQMSLPMSAKERFLSKLLAVCKIHIFPLITAEITLTLFCILTAGITLNNFRYLTSFMLLLTLAALFVDSVTVFCMCCCGAKAESAYTSMITLFCVTVTPILFYIQITEHFSTVEISGGFEKIFFSWGLTPLIFLVDITGEGTGITGWILLNCLISCLVIFLSYFIYRKRDARTVGKPMVYAVFFELFLFMGLSTIYCIFFFSEVWWIGLTIAIICYLIIRITSARKNVTIVKFISWLFKFAVSTAVIIGIAAAGYLTNGFGYEKRLPDLSEVKNGGNTLYLNWNERCEDDFGEEYWAYRVTKYEDVRYAMTDSDKQALMEQIKIVRSYALEREHTAEDFIDILFNGEELDDYNPSYGRVNVSIYFNEYVDSVDFTGDSEDYSICVNLTYKQVEELKSQLVQAGMSEDEEYNSMD